MGQWEKAEAVLAEMAIALSSEQRSTLQRHLELVREWNDFASLVSSGDLGCLNMRHLVDSLSLLPVLDALLGAGGGLWDIGSGGGFPAIPLKVMRPGLEVHLLERSERKVGFLRKVIGALGLEGVTLRHGSFPEGVAPAGIRVITARAVEKPAALLRQLAKRMPENAVFVCQSSDPEASCPGLFHVERVEDAWSERGLRRGALHLLRRL